MYDKTAFTLLQGTQVSVAALSTCVEVNELPTWMQKDQYIRHGYRTPQYSLRGCYESLWYLHNETVNIWSHLLTALLMLLLLSWSCSSMFQQTYAFPPVDLMVLQFYLICSFGCSVFSVGDVVVQSLLSRAGG